MIMAQIIILWILTIQIMPALAGDVLIAAKLVLLLLILIIKHQITQHSLGHMGIEKVELASIITAHAGQMDFAIPILKILL